MASEISCPRCGVSMEQRIGARHPKARVLEVDRCPQCGGLWLDEFEAPELGREVAKLAFLTDELRARWPTSTRFAACPRCATEGADGLREVSLLDVVIDFCLRCRGLYLDAGEAQALTRAAAEMEQAHATGSYRAAPQVQRAIGSRTFHCSRCGVERPTTESCILPAGLVCGPCFYERDEAALAATAGAGFSDAFASPEAPPTVVPFLVRRKAAAGSLAAEPIFSRLGVALGMLGFGYCAVCGRRAYDSGCRH